MQPPDTTFPWLYKYIKTRPGRKRIFGLFRARKKPVWWLQNWCCLISVKRNL